MHKKCKRLEKKLKPIIPKTSRQDGAYLDTLKQLMEDRTD